MSHVDRIFLIGPMGAGKSTIGRRLAEQLGLSFVDLDAALEARTGVDIPRIFDIEGEAGFRRREADLLAELTEQPRICLATGGGAVLNETSQLNLSARGVVIYLRARVDTQLARTRQSDRPLLQGNDPRGRLEALLTERGPIYEALADITIDTEAGNPDRLARLLAERVQDTGLTDNG
jgi:shikimate kinase